VEREEIRRELAAKKKAIKEATDGMANPPRLWLRRRDLTN